MIEGEPPSYESDDRELRLRIAGGYIDYQSSNVSLGYLLKGLANDSVVRGLNDRLTCADLEKVSEELKQICLKGLPKHSELLGGPLVGQFVHLFQVLQDV